MYNWRIELFFIGGDYGLPLAEINDIIDVVTFECYNHTTYTIYNKDLY